MMDQSSEESDTLGKSATNEPHIASTITTFRNTATEADTQSTTLSGPYPIVSTVSTQSAKYYSHHTTQSDAEATGPVVDENMKAKTTEVETTEAETIESRTTAAEITTAATTEAEIDKANTKTDGSSLKV